jgi:hypothetical protein
MQSGFSMSIQVELKGDPLFLIFEISGKVCKENQTYFAAVVPQASVLVIMVRLLNYYFCIVAQAYNSYRVTDHT